MNLKILGSLLTIGLVSSALGYGTYAFFSDTEASTDNIFTAGDLDLTLDNVNGVTATITGANFAPGDATAGSIILRNEGSIFNGDAENHAVDLDFKVATTVTDDTGNPNDPDDGGTSAVPFDEWLVLTSLTYGTTDLLATITDANNDGLITLAEFEAHGVFTDLADPLAAGKTLSLDVDFHQDGPNYLKRDEVDLTFTFFLAQSGEADLT